MLTYGFGVGARGTRRRAGGARSTVTPLMGANLIIVVFAVVVIGGMGSIIGSIITGFGLGHHRGPDQGVLPRSFQHRGLRDHGHRADDPARRPVRNGRAEEARMQELRHAASSLALIAVLPRCRAARALSRLPDEGAVLRAVRLRVQPADRLRRACCPSATPLFFGFGAYVSAAIRSRRGAGRRSLASSRARLWPC